ncbi:non-receptor serine/threonine protein kinase [Lithospermum erythrorhizon]|uniref:non-specific serine/threonine protein kinase n=1 Tax=Lithospermum erythrorhizon TaxID=34254 RepID=A0AAV3PWH0_LITER
MGNVCVTSKGAEEGMMGSISKSLGLSKSRGEASEASTHYQSNFGSEGTLDEAPDVVMIEEMDRKKEKQNSMGRKVVKEKNKKPENAKRIVSAGLQNEYVLEKKRVRVKEHFNLGMKLGDGQYGTTYYCVEKATGKEYACKSISKKKLVTQEEIELVRREIEIIHHLSENPNVISIKDSYEDSESVHIIMELCTGGELFDRIVRFRHYTEKKAAELARNIVGVVQTSHSLGVVHRDLKPENFLFVNEDEDSPLKIIDFGLSVLNHGELLTDMVGNPYYVAPDVLLRSYGPEADVWSAGVIIYMILSGSPPFYGETQEEIFKEILHGNVDFSSDPWPKISDSAKDLVRKMLVRDPKKRITAHEILCHPWVRINGVAPDNPIDTAVSSRLKQFSDMEKLKRMTLRVITENLYEEEIDGLKDMFKMIGTDDSNQITLEELKDGMKRFGANLDVLEMKSLMQSVGFDSNGSVDYQEFIAATLHLHKIEKDDLLKAAFSYLDKDDSGFISRDELQKACEQFGVDVTGMEQIIQEADQNNDGHIDYQEFVAVMQKGNINFDKRLQSGSNIRMEGATPVC